VGRRNKEGGKETEKRGRGEGRGEGAKLKVDEEGCDKCKDDQGKRCRGHDARAGSDAGRGLISIGAGAAKLGFLIFRQ